MVTIDTLKNEFSKSIDRKSDCTLLIYKENSKEYLRYNLYPHCIKSLNEFKSSGGVLDSTISNVIFDYRSEFDSNIIDTLVRSNVHSIQALYQNDKVEHLRLPSNIKTIKTNSRMNPSTYPEQLESLEIHLDRASFSASIQSKPFEKCNGTNQTEIIATIYNFNP
ncbi:hypothetical protein PPL_05345 [Heterostelium album PN500]|uniref:Uncharacterized protein n=1 Tax=Heterostelium pallidum (strain ATCC 26659 / Pp 5 / PN500) TaxID=670386 RepID=D3B9X5_HETP5|nr:hypothetical protein PPL_05345 [Heterostelium album PN500]EFA81362.1 hypothetical protein PPL_05345 [Heterostelium album PN500]|eukprot:XP_020433480.1 hypothetical protein PPL_05345 [Heterostelium album PN500]